MKWALLLAGAGLFGGEMIAVRKGEERGRTEMDWLLSYHTFSFSEYHDPAFMGFRTLRVINEDFVEPGKGFGMHPHKDMEILTYVMKGALEHKDTMGNHSKIGAGEFQLMTAGSGVKHSEFNPSKGEAVHLLQIWILPGQKGLEPGYQQKSFPGENGLKLVVSPDGAQGSLKIHQDARIYLGKGEEEPVYELAAGRYAWVQATEGDVVVADAKLKAGDGASFTGGKKIGFSGSGEFLLFDLK